MVKSNHLVQERHRRSTTTYVTVVKLRFTRQLRRLAVPSAHFEGRPKHANTVGFLLNSLFACLCGSLQQSNARPTISIRTKYGYD